MTGNTAVAGASAAAGANAVAEANAVVEAILADLRRGGHRGVVVDSPPGAGKSTLVVRAAGELAAAGERVIVIAQTNEQVDDLIDRLALANPALPVGRLSATDYLPSARVAAHPTVLVAEDRRPGRADGHRRDRREVGDGVRGDLALGDRRRGVPDALGRAAARRPAVRAGAVRRRPGAAGPVLHRGERAVDRADLGSDAERRRGAAAAQPRPAGAPAAGVVAAAGLGRAAGVARRSTRSPVSGRAPAQGID